MELEELAKKLKSEAELICQKYGFPPLVDEKTENKLSPEMKLEEIVEILRKKRAKLNKDNFVLEQRDVLAMAEIDDLLEAINNPEYVPKRTKRTNVTVFASGGGTDFQSLIDGCHNGLCPHVDISGLISNNPSAGALERVKENFIPAIHLEKKQFASVEDYNQELLRVLKALRTEIIFLAGYIKLIPEELTREYPIYNIHPSILPKHGGKGMYGLAVHESVITSGDKKTGVTIHQVNEKYDEGAIINQYHDISVLPNDTPEILQQRVLAFEHKIIPVVFEQLAQDYQLREESDLGIRHR